MYKMIPQTFILICLIFITSCNENKKNGDLSNTKEVSDSSLYADIDMFQLKGIDKSQTAPAATGTLPKPYLTPAGDLVIPSASDPKYHWWKKDGQKVDKTVAELRAEAV